MGHQKTQLATLKAFHDEITAALPLGKPLDRDAFHRLLIVALEVGYPQVYSVIKTGVVLGLWVQEGGRNGSFRIVPQPMRPTPSQEQPATPTPGR